MKVILVIVLTVLAVPCEADMRIPLPPSILEGHTLESRLPAHAI